MNQIITELQYRIRTSQVITMGLSYVVEDQKAKLERETTTLKKKSYLEILEKTMGTASAICHHINITRGTFYNWMNSDPEFKASVFQMKSDVLNDIEETVVKMALKEDLQAAKFILSKKHPDYKKKTTENKESIVHIYHHTFPKKENDHKMTAEEDIDQYFNKDVTEEYYINGIISEVKNVRIESEELPEEGHDLDKN